MPSVDRKYGVLLSTEEVAEIFNYATDHPWLNGRKFPGLVQLPPDGRRMFKLDPVMALLRYRLRADAQNGSKIILMDIFDDEFKHHKLIRSLVAALIEARICRHILCFENEDGTMRCAECHLLLDENRHPKEG
jgi:hypothetical protein